MKKFLWIIPICLITCGCFSYNKTLVCTISEKYDDIDTEIKITTNFEKGFSSSAIAVATMTFSSEDDANSYYESYKGDRSNLKLQNNQLIVTTEEKFDNDEDTKTREQVKTYFENSGYTCK